MKFLFVKKRIGGDIWANSRLKAVSNMLSLKGKKVLDLGCGEGTYLGDYFNALGNNILYGDLDLELMEKMKAENKIVLDATNLPFADNAFDLIICADVLEHIKDDRTALLEIYRCVKPKGYALLMLPAHSFLYSKNQIKLGHWRRYDKNNKLLLFFKNTGFKIKKVRYSVWILFPLLYLIQKIGDETCLYGKRGKIYKNNRIEILLSPLLNFLCWLDSIIKMPFGLSLIYLLEKPNCYFRKNEKNA